MLDYNIVILYIIIKNMEREKGEFGKIAFITINELTKASRYVALLVPSLTSDSQIANMPKGGKALCSSPPLNSVILWLKCSPCGSGLTFLTSSP